MLAASHEAPNDGVGRGNSPPNRPLWVLNGLGDTYLSLMAVVGDALAVPDGYRAAQHGVLDALESGDGAAARTTLTRYLEDLDRSIVAALPPALQELLQEQGAT